VLGYDSERLLWFPVFPGEAEVPTLDLLPPNPPLIGPGEDTGSGESVLNGALQLPLQNLGLPLLPLGGRVQT
jgi:hypothetical protein